jgi:hypothetical protein
MKKGLLLDDAFTASKKAADGAINSVRSLLGEPLDPDLIIYKQAAEEDFDRLASEVGSEPVMDYIHRMEAKLLQGVK